MSPVPATTPPVAMATSSVSFWASTTTTAAAASSAPDGPSSTTAVSSSVPSKDSGVSVQAVFYGIAAVGLVIAIVYTIRLVRRDRRRRRERRERSPAVGRHTLTFRPEDDDAPHPPPQYRAYALDQPYIEPEMAMIHPENVHYLGHGHGLSESEFMSSRQHLINAGNTELHELSESIPERPHQPVLSTDTAITMTTTINSPPQSPSRQSITTSDAAERDGEPSATSSNVSPPVISTPPTARRATITMAGNIRSGILQPIFSRLLGQGPPPYIPTAPEDALPQHPPEYTTAVSD